MLTVENIPVLSIVWHICATKFNQLSYFSKSSGQKLIWIKISKNKLLFYTLLDNKKIKNKNK